ncbi:MAG: tetraacyldisaccharide 4'-kinase [Desulfocapsa sp.]|nr:tetraacyldisaccharide 4'-kinase [Desulfocapsa sp.]
MFGRPFSPIYSAIMRARESLYQKNIKKRYKLDVPVISVGNLTMGGTGKTPIVGLLASMLLEKGFKPAIISRGYGGAADNKVNVVSDGNEIFMDPKAAGDEPCFLAANLPGIAVLTGIVRVLPCRHAIEKLGCNILILDDGFQHMAIKRDLDLVLFSAAKLAGNSRVFPGGDLREPVAALKRCNAFLLTGMTEELKERADKFAKLLSERFPDKPIFLTSYKSVGAKSLADDEISDLSELPSHLYGFCGIAQPELFKKSLTEENVQLTGFLPLKDHQPFTSALIKKINQQATDSGAKGLITTEKDIVKLKQEHFDLPCYSLKMEVSTNSDFDTFIDTTFQLSP